jgi:hypothetical protein
MLTAATPVSAFQNGTQRVFEIMDTLFWQATTDKVPSPYTKEHTGKFYLIRMDRATAQKKGSYNRSQVRSEWCVLGS